jgi:hypothetical protein
LAIAYGAEVLTHIVKNGYSFQYPPNWDLTERQNRFRPIDAYLRTEGNVIAFQRINSSYDAPDNDNALLQGMEYVIKNVYPDAYIYESGTPLTDKAADAMIERMGDQWHAIVQQAAAEQTFREKLAKLYSEGEKK